MIRTERRDRVLLVTLDRPERRNAIDTRACDDLRTAIAEAESTGARVVVITGAGGHFCAGADFGEVATTEFRAALRALLDAIVETPLVVMAAVDGAALGAGTQLAVAADLRVATAAARFGIPAARLGAMVDQWTVRRVALLAGAGPARAMLLAAEEIDGGQALALGLVQRTCDLDAALAWAHEIAALAPLTVAGHKLALNRLEAALADDPEIAAALQRAWASADLHEGMAAFRERRRPAFEGR